LFEVYQRMKITLSNLREIVKETISEIDPVQALDEKEGKKDACYYKVKGRYKVWPSAYASGALVKCRKVGASNWGNKSKKKESVDHDLLKQIVEEEVAKLAEKKSNPRVPRKKGQKAKSKKHSDLYTDEDPKGTIHGLKFATEADATKSVSKIKSSGRSHAHKVQAAVAMEQRAKAAGKASSAAVYRKYINSVKKEESLDEEPIEEKKRKLTKKPSSETSLRDWFGRKGAKGSKSGWVDCNTCRKDKKTGRKKCGACGRESGESRSKYPKCRPTPSACGDRGGYGKKSKAGKKG